jgi:hypothetical protein
MYLKSRMKLNTKKSSGGLFVDETTPFGLRIGSL